MELGEAFRAVAALEQKCLALGDPAEVLESLMAEREPLYREIADLTVETDGRKVHAVAKDVLDRLE